MNSKNIENPAKNETNWIAYQVYSMNAGIHCKYVHLIDMACPRAVTLYLKIMMILRKYDDTIIF